MKKLIAFYSRADENYFSGSYRTISVGNTEKIAKMIADKLGGVLFKIEQKIPYSANYRACIAEAQKDLHAKARPELISLPESIDEYDEIYLGYPNYWGNMPMAVYTFLENFEWKGKTIHPFCTHEGNGLSDTVKEIEKVCSGAIITKGLAIQGGAVEHSQKALETWIESI